MIGRNKTSGLPVYNHSFAKDENGIEVLRVSPIITDGVVRSTESVKFAMSETAQLVGTTEIISDYFKLDKYREFDIFVTHTSLVPIEVRVITRLNGGSLRIAYYDWNTSTWKAHSNDTTSPGVELRSSANTTFALSTHPDFYWLRELKVGEFRVGIRALIQPDVDGTARVWVGGYK